jgi:hypothetical protein
MRLPTKPIYEDLQHRQRLAHQALDQLCMGRVTEDDELVGMPNAGRQTADDLSFRKTGGP